MTVINELRHTCGIPPSPTAFSDGWVDLSHSAKTEGGEIEREGGRRVAAQPSDLALGRRSGRFPPLPYPPPRQLDFNKAHGLVRRNPAQKTQERPLDSTGSFRDANLHPAQNTEKNNIA